MAKRWYIVHAFSNFENKVAQSLKEQADQRGLAHLFDEILVPSEEVIEVRKGRRLKVDRKLYPGYVLVNVDLTDDAYHLIKNTPKVTGFLGADKAKPVPISSVEAERIKGQIKEAAEFVKPAISFEIGEQVKVAEGPFASFNGIVEDVDDARSRVKVAVSIFGRATPVELEFSQVQKLR
jgi:transcriptional antiterminator NusG